MRLKDWRMSEQVGIIFSIALDCYNIFHPVREESIAHSTMSRMILPINGKKSRNRIFYPSRYCQKDTLIVLLCVLCVYNIYAYVYMFIKGSYSKNSGIFSWIRTCAYIKSLLPVNASFGQGIISFSRSLQTGLLVARIPLVEIKKHLQRWWNIISNAIRSIRISNMICRNMFIKFSVIKE